MNLFQKITSKLPKWEEISKNMPFIITVSIGMAFIFMSNGDIEKKQNEQVEI